MTNLDPINSWDVCVLRKAVDNCHCNPYGDVALTTFFVLSLYENIRFFDFLERLTALIPGRSKKIRLEPGSAMSHHEVYR